MSNFNDSKISKPEVMKSESTKPKTNKSKCMPPGVNAFIDTPGDCNYVFKDAVDIFDGFEVDANFVEASRSAVMFGTSSVSIPSAPTVGFRGGKAIFYHSDTPVSSPGWSTKNVASMYSKSCNNISVSEFHN